ncbi:MAG TPA: hypothetical protein VNF28_02800 [Candidatus Binataceae bacterium]|nr:hypothetical protein [Candidatus Binataceae bacterium]
MDYGAAESRGEEKFQLILGQVTSIRSRLNALALQQGLFGGLTFILGAVVLIVGAAFAFSPLTFLLLGVAVTAAALVGVVRTAGRAWRMRTSDERAALIADQRAALKGRLTTMVDAGRIEQRSTLWPYLIEDTLALREEFVADKVEPRRVSRWLWAALASCAVAALVMRLAYGVRNSRLIASNRIASIPGEPTADLGDLDIRPADPSANPGTEIDADPATLRKLAEKLREAQNNSGRPGSPTSRLMADARDAASALQNRLTGGKPAEAASRLRLTDRKGGDANKSAKRSQDHSQAKGSKQNPQNPDSEQQPDQNQTQPSGAPPPGTPDMSGLAALNGLNNDDPNPNSTPPNTPPDSHKLSQGGPLGAGGSNHGSGTDPRHLYGEADKPPLGNDTFRIPVEVGPSEDGSSNTAPASPPRRTKSMLNASQAPDEPFERASIPASDRVTIKRVFER